MKRRAWLPLSLLVALAAFLLWNWGVRAAPRQSRVMGTGAAVILALMGLAVWGFFLAGLRGRGRALLLLAVAGVVVAVGALVELRGFSGDLVPILGWRFAAGPPDLAAPAPTPSAERPAAPAARDYPQFLGPERDAIVRGVRLARDWSAHPPVEVWRRPVGAGWSSFAVSAGLAITQEQRGDDEAVVAYELADGTVRWLHTERARYFTDIAGEGPRATPTIADGRVFAIGGTGRLCALELETGALLWSRALLTDEEVPDWGFSGSPLVVGDSVIVNPSTSHGSLAAFDCADGEPRWSAGEHTGGYSSPMLCELAGRPQVLTVDDVGLEARSPDGGTLLWSTPWGGRNPNVAQPVVVEGDRVVLSSGYGVGCALFQVTAAPSGELSAERVWFTRSLKAKFSNFVQREGVLYGLDDGTLAAVDLATGRRLWKEGRYGHGQLLLVDDLLLLTSEAGELLLLTADPAGPTELARLPVLDGRAWNSQAFAAPFLLLRNDREAVCLELALE